MRVLICYATTDGQTRKIAEYIADYAKERGHQVEVFDVIMATDVDPSRYDTAIVAGSVHMGRYQTALIHQIKHWHAALNAIPTAFVSVSLSASSDDPHIRAEIDECAQHMLRDTGLRPVETFHVAGAMRFSEYDFFRRWLMRLAAKQMDKSIDSGRDLEYTDWNAVAAFVDRFLAGK